MKREYLLMLAGAGAAYLIWKTTQAAKQGATSLAQTVGNSINPLNDQNIFNQATNATVQKLTGDPTQTLGGWIYDATHTNDFGQAAPIKKTPAIGSLFEGNPYDFGMSY